MADEMKDYVDNFRANLPSGITYDSTISRYFCNGRRFLNEWEVGRYLNYIKKFGFSAGFPYSGVLLLETSPDKLLLEGGTDAILLEGIS